MRVFFFYLFFILSDILIIQELNRAQMNSELSKLSLQRMTETSSFAHI